MPPVTTSAIILHVIPYGETSKILKLLTPDMGLVSAIARGARRARSRTGPRLDLFGAGQASLLVKPHRDLHPLTAFELTATHGRLGADVSRFAAACGLAEVMLRCGGPDPNPEAFEAALAGFAALDRAEDALAPATALAAGWALVESLGFQPTLDACVVCDRPVHDGVQFSPAQGGAVCDAHRAGGRVARLAPADASALAALLAGDLPDPPLDERHAAAHRRLLLGFIRWHLAEHREMPALAFWDAEAWNGT